MELMTTKNDAMHNIFLVTFHGSVKVWYHNIDPKSIIGLHDLCMKLITHFSTNILSKKSTTKLFAIT